MSTVADKKFLHALALAGAEADTLSVLEGAFHSYEAAWRAGASSLRAAGLAEERVRAIAEARESADPDEQMRELVSAGIALVAAGDPDFPSALLEISSPPHALYIKGRIPAELPRLAVVGTRKATAYGREAARRLIRDLARESRAAIVSGLAEGIDAAAHEAAIEAGLPTIGVLGGGMDRESFFPPVNWKLAEEMIAHDGAIISEYPPGAPALKHRFPARNRIIAGLSSGVLVVEAPERSGALITARFALEQGRDVLAVPGQMFNPNAAGTHRLIQDGAALVTHADDIINALGLSRRSPSEQAAALLPGETERAILKLLDEPASVDDIKERTDLATADIVSCLSLLELKGFVRPMGQNRYQRIS